LVYSQFIRFLMTGGIAAAANMGSRYLLNLFMRFEVAVAVAYLIGMTIAYVLARAFVFEASSRGIASEFRRFTIVNLFALACVWAISVGLARFLFPMIGFTWNADDVAHVIGVLAPAVTSFVGHRYYSFRQPSSQSISSPAPTR
jgi:putative flippase GtrA